MPRLLTLLTALLLVSLTPAAAAEVEPGSGSWPLRPRPEVVRGFDPPSRTWGAGHRGVDLAGRLGMPVHAAQAGTVTFVGRIAGVGSVSVSHGPTRTTYQPVAAAVRRGEEVTEGAVIGHLAFAGSHCLPRACLHWGLIAGNRYLDPLVLVGAEPQPVRLFPPDGALPGSPGIPVTPAGPAVVVTVGGHEVPGRRFGG